MRYNSVLLQAHHSASGMRISAVGLHAETLCCFKHIFLCTGCAAGPVGLRVETQCCFKRIILHTGCAKALWACAPRLSVASSTSF